MEFFSSWTFLSLLETKEFLLFVRTGAFIFKAFILGFFIKDITRRKRIPSALAYLFVVLVIATFEDVSWIVSLSNKLFFNDYYQILNLVTVRLAWALTIVMYQSLHFFIETFKNKNIKIKIYHSVFLSLSSILFALNSYVIFFGGSDITPWELLVREYTTRYIFFCLMPTTLLLGLLALRKKNLPLIVRLQLKTSLQFFLLPHLIANIWELYPFTFSVVLTNCNAAVSFSAIFLSLTIYHCIRRIIGLRFLDYHEHVHDDQKFNFVKDFKSVLEDLGKASNISEIKSLTQRFFHSAFETAPENTFLSIRSLNNIEQADKVNPASYRETTVETFIEIHNEQLKDTPQALEVLQQKKILVYDELAYDQFYNPNEVQKTLLSLLEKINADIFLPIYEDNTIIAYITVQMGSRNGRLYTNVDRDEMLVFASYLSKVINLLQNRNLQELFKQKKEMIEELYNKHQEINRYKETIRSFLRNNKDHSAGVFYYKSRRFTFGNQTATEMLGLDPNTDTNNPVTKKIKTMVNQITSYKSSQTQIITNAKGKKIVILGMPHPEANGALFVAHYPEISDTIKHLVDTVKDPSDWDYLLYLETTESGRLINKLIPSSEEQFITFKVELLKSALSKKALLLSLPEEDLIPTVEILHHISLRENMHILELKGPVESSEIPISLFGINNLFGSSTTQPLLEKLNRKGTLVIKNIHFLDLNSQNNLAECIRYGFYKVFKSNKKIQTDVRIITSSNQDLRRMTQEGTFSQALYNELKHTSLSMPSLLTLESNDMDSLVEGFADQALAEDSTAKVVNITDKEKTKIFNQKPVSLFEVKRKVENLVLTKAKTENIYEKTKFNPAYNISDPQLALAAQMGKHALKDEKIMSLLWNKFKNQNRIAEFLGVNRSSVHRRCKHYGLV